MSEPKPRRAVALRYDLGGDSAPLVVAKGERLVAERIIDEARRLGLSVVENQRLSDSLISLELYQEIPPEVYQAVAEVIAFVYRLEHRSTGVKA